MRPPTHDDPNAIPRNGTDVPWPELDDPGHGPTSGREARGARDGAAAPGEAQRRR
jgi:hypothetical protein